MAAKPVKKTVKTAPKKTVKKAATKAAKKCAPPRLKSWPLAAGSYGVAGVRRFEVL